MQIKTSRVTVIHLLEWEKKNDHPNASKYVKILDHSYIAVGNLKWYRHYENW